MEANTLEFIRSILQKNLNANKQRAFLFGSRAIGNNKKYSDFDIGIEGETLYAETLFKINEELEESDLPYIVQIIDFNDVSEEFKDEAKKKIITLNL